MQTTKNDIYDEFKSSDCNGEFVFTICKKGGIQIQLESENGDENAYINVDLEELTAIRDLINGVLEERMNKSQMVVPSADK